jgi:maltoporin
MNGFNLYGNSMITAGNHQSSEKRLRFVNHTTFDVTDKWAFHLSVNHERHIDAGTVADQWLGAGIHPVYKMTQNFQLVGEVGHSIVQNNGAHKLTRLTFAPQLSINESIWGRPVLRAYYTHSFWNNLNNSNIAQNAPTYANQNNGGSYGLQMESFF